MPSIQLARCTDMYSAFEKTGKLADMLAKVKDWKMALSKIESLDENVSVGIGSDIEKCQAKLNTKSANKFAKFLVDHMHDLFMMKKAQHHAMKECAANVDAAGFQVS